MTTSTRSEASVAINALVSSGWRAWRSDRLGLAALALVAPLAFGAPRASACDWRWCGDRPYAGRHVPSGYAYRGYGYRAYRYGIPRWAYGYNPARAYGYAYAPWPSTSMPDSEWYLDTAAPVPNSATAGLTGPITSGYGLLTSGLPAKGPSLFGTEPESAPMTSGYYNGYYYNAPTGSYYYAPTRNRPPRDTPSWWVEPRRGR